MNNKELLNIMRNELHCVQRQVDGICNNKRDCTHCDLTLPDHVIISAYKQVINMLESKSE